MKPTVSRCAREQIYEPLLGIKVGGTEVRQGLPANGQPAWMERNGHSPARGQFHDGSLLDASDVVATYVALWDAASPNHVGRTGSFEYFTAFFNKFLNAPAE